MTMPAKYKTKKYKPRGMLGAHVVFIVFTTGMLGMLLLFYLIGVGKI